MFWLASQTGAGSDGRASGDGCQPTISIAWPFTGLPLWFGRLLLCGLPIITATARRRGPTALARIARLRQDSLAGEISPLFLQPHGWRNGATR